MNEQEQTVKAGGISSDAAQAATGKSWAEWFAILDAAEATAMNHKQIVAYLGERYQIAPWWQQMVTVAYEQERGLREKHETGRGYQVSATKTVAVPVADLFAAWQNDTVRAQWLPDPDITIRKATPGKSMRVTWVDGQTNVDVNFYSRGDSKSQVSVEHSKLADPNEAAEMKAYWAKSLQALKELLEAAERA